MLKFPVYSLVLPDREVTYMLKVVGIWPVHVLYFYNICISPLVIYSIIFAFLIYKNRVILQIFYNLTSFTQNYFPDNYLSNVDRGRVNLCALTVEFYSSASLYKYIIIVY